MYEQVTTPCPAMDTMEVVGFTVYMSADVAEVSRVLQVLVRQSIRIERFNANLKEVEHGYVQGRQMSHNISAMRLVIVGSVAGPSDVERATKLLNRLVSVYKVVVSTSV